MDVKVDEVAVPARFRGSEGRPGHPSRVPAARYAASCAATSAASAASRNRGFRRKCERISADKHALSATASWPRRTHAAAARDSTAQSADPPLVSATPPPLPQGRTGGAFAEPMAQTSATLPANGKPQGQPLMPFRSSTDISVAVRRAMSLSGSTEANRRRPTHRPVGEAPGVGPSGCASPTMIPSGPADEAEPIDALILDDLVDQLGAMGPAGAPGRRRGRRRRT